LNRAHANNDAFGVVVHFAQGEQPETAWLRRAQHRGFTTKPHHNHRRTSARFKED
jgi:hypothetical protein